MRVVNCCVDWEPEIARVCLVVGLFNFAHYPESNQKNEVRSATLRCRFVCLNRPVITVLEAILMGRQTRLQITAFVWKVQNTT